MEGEWQDGWAWARPEMECEDEGTARVGGEWPLETVRFGVADALMTHGPATMTRVAVWRFGLAQGAPPCGRPLSRTVLSNGFSCRQCWSWYWQR